MGHTIREGSEQIQIYITTQVRKSFPGAVGKKNKKDRTGIRRENSIVIRIEEYNGKRTLKREQFT